MAARRHAADEDAVVAGVRLHPHAVAEDGAAGERAGRIDGDDADGPPGGADGVGQPIDERALARAGRTGDADQIGAAGVGKQIAQQRRARGRFVFDQRDRPGDGARIAREHTVS